MDSVLERIKEISLQHITSYIAEIFKVPAAAYFRFFDFVGGKALKRISMERVG